MAANGVGEGVPGVSAMVDQEENQDSENREVDDVKEARILRSRTIPLPAEIVSSRSEDVTKSMPRNLEDKSGSSAPVGPKEHQDLTNQGFDGQKDLEEKRNIRSGTSPPADEMSGRPQDVITTPPGSYQRKPAFTFLTGSSENRDSANQGSDNPQDLREGDPITPPSETNATQKESTSNLSRLTPLCSYCMIVAVVVAVLVRMFYFRGITSSIISESKPMTWEEAELKFEADMRNIMKSYNHQALETHIHILSSVSSTLKSLKPRQPSPLVFLTPPTLDVKFGSCLARNIGQKVNDIFRNVTQLAYSPDVLELDSDYLNDETSVTNIHAKLNKYLEKGTFVIINNPQEVREKDKIMIFHAFCDNSAAPHKRATFIFVIPVPEPTYRKYDWIPENEVKIADEILETSWDSVEPDKRRATITRVAASATLLNPGDSCG